MTLDTASRLADLEQQLGEVRDNMEAACAQIEDQVVSVRGQVEVARASLNTIRQQLTSGGAPRPLEVTSRTNPVPRPSVPRLAPEGPPPPPRMDEEVAPRLDDLRAAVDALKRPRRVEPANESPNQAEADL